MVDEKPPMLRIVRGRPSPEELAALVAVLATTSTPEASAPVQRHSAWTDRSRAVRRPLAHGPGAWRGQAWPR